MGWWISPPARCSKLRGRDRITLVAVARAIGTAYPEVPEPTAETLRQRPYGAVVLRALDVSLPQLAQAVHSRFERFHGAVTVGREDVRACLPYESQAQWQLQMTECHAQLSSDLGTVTLGHAVQRGIEANNVQQALVQAAEAALLGDDLFGPGQITSYADAQLARFLLDHRQPHELGSLYERAIGKLAAQDPKLVTTLEMYCASVAMVGTAEKLGVHRNTVLYRLKLIEDITGMDLDDDQCATLSATRPAGRSTGPPHEREPTTHRDRTASRKSWSARQNDAGTDCLDAGNLRIGGGHAGQHNHMDPDPGLPGSARSHRILAASHQ